MSESAELRCPSQVFLLTLRATECKNKVVSTSSSGFLRKKHIGTTPQHGPFSRSGEESYSRKMFKNCRKEDLRIVAFELGETVAEKVTIVERES
ncbi:hypothetical protein TNCV_1384711 [Trichonephila clavipes]|nr:hypothetical protein TNCV_1384711 [Trichonephila clavipes]